MKTFILLGVKVLLTIGLFALALRSIDISDVYLHIKRVPLPNLLLVGVLFLVQLAISAVRLSAITDIIASAVSLTNAIRINWIGAFFSQALVTFVSGDVVRAMLLSRNCAIPMRNSARVITLDRIIGLLSSMLIVSMTTPWAMTLTSDEAMRRSIIVLAVVGALLILGFAVIGYLARHPALVQVARMKAKDYRIVYIILDTIAVARHLFTGWRHVPKILATSLLIQVINVSAIYVLINAMGANVSIWQCLLIVPTVMLISLLPFSIGGWGLRESAMATGFSLVQTDPSSALAASVMFGIFTLLLALPGGVLWLSSSNKISLPSTNV